jgi:hypothetical protein
MVDPLDLEERAKDLYWQNAKDYSNATPWELLHEDTRQLWREWAERRMTDGPLG